MINYGTISRLSEGRKVFYVYVLRDPRDGRIFYVGCSRDPVRRLCSRKGYNPRVESRINDIRAGGFRVRPQFLCRLGSAEHAGFQERYAVERLSETGVGLLNHPWGSFYRPACAGRALRKDQ